MGLCQHTLAAWNPLFSNCFEVRAIRHSLLDANADFGFFVQIAMAFLISFFAKALSATGYFCYASLSTSTSPFRPSGRITQLILSLTALCSLGWNWYVWPSPRLPPCSADVFLFFPRISVMILPGYVLLTATLELASKVMVPGSIRLVFGVLLSLFLGTGISLGSKLYVCEY